MTDDHEITCNLCGTDEGTLTNTQQYGWVCDDCLSEHELIDIVRDYEP